MISQDNINYIIKVLKCDEPQIEPDWYETLGFLFCHKIAGLFYNKSVTLGLKLPKKLDFILRDAFEKQKRSVVCKREYIKKISEALKQSGAKHVFLKGSVLANAKFDTKRIYMDGERVSNDIDILVGPTEITAVSDVLRDLNFIQGIYDRNKREIFEFSRMEIIKRRMTRGEVAPFVKITDNAEFPFVEIDINFSLGNTPEDGQELLRAIIQTASYRKGEADIYSPNNEMFFAHLIMHQYKESCLYFMVQRSKELDLYKLADMYYLLKNNVIDLNMLDGIIKRYEIENQAGAVLEQVGEVFNDDRILQLAREYGGKQPPVIDYENKKQYVWQTDVRSRLCKFSAIDLLKEADIC